MWLTVATERWSEPSTLRVEYGVPGTTSPFPAKYSGKRWVRYSFIQTSGGGYRSDHQISQLS